MRLAIVTAMWKRPEVFNIFGMNTAKLIRECEELDIKVFVAGSEGEKSRELAESFGFEYVETPNEPLYQKWNVAVQSSRGWRPDHVLLMGSDDIMDAIMMGNYIEPMRNRIDFIGCTDWMFYDIESENAIYWGGYKEAFRKGQTVGAGRMFSRRLLNRIDWQPWQSPVGGEGMDGTMMRKLSNYSYTKRTFKMGLGMGLDIKSSTNITPFKMWPNSFRVRPELIKNRFIGL